ncbi:MAG: ATP-grasp domain-containing protein [Halorhodospira sp.]
MPQTSTLILGACPRIVVPIARCLRRHGLSVVAGSLLPSTPAIPSRALREFRQLTPPSLSEDAFREELGRLIADHGVDTLIPTGDEVLTALAGDEAHWRQRVHLCSPPWAVARQVLDKAQTLRLAERCGVAYPRSLVLHRPEDIERLPEDFPFPAILKPADKGRSNQLRLRYFDDRTALERFVAEHARADEPWLIQEHVGGYGLGIEVLMHGGEPLTVFQHNRLKEYPVSGGVAARCSAHPVNPELLAQATQLLRALSWQGVAMVEYRHDPHSGRTVLMEVNGRYWGSVALPLQCGVELPWYEWQLAHGQQPQPASYRTGRRMRWLAGDLQRLPEAAGAAIAGEIPIRQVAHDTLTFFTDFLAPRTRDALWRFNDPRPALDDLNGALRQVGTQVLRKFGKLALPQRGYQGLEHIITLGPRGAWQYRRLRRSGPPNPPEAQRLRDARSILFICHGNIARSAMSAAWLRSALQKQDAEHVAVESAGVAALDGKSADPDAVAAAPQFGISLEHHRARRVTADHVAAADAIFVMDYLNWVRLMRQFPEARGKTWLLSSLDPDARRLAERGGEIRDPYGQGKGAAEACFSQIVPCLETLLRHLMAADRTPEAPQR